MPHAPTDLVAILLVGEAAAQHGAHWEKIGLQKSIFLTELEQQRRKLPAPGFRFYRYKRGPYSRDLEESRIALEASGWVERNSPRLTEEARKIVQGLLPVLHQIDSAVFDSLWTNALAVSKYDSEELGRQIYQLELGENDWPGRQRIRVEDIPQREVIIEPDAFPSGTLEKALPAPVRHSFELLFSVRPEEVEGFNKVTEHSIDNLDELLKT